MGHKAVWLTLRTAALRARTCLFPINYCEGWGERVTASPHEPDEPHHLTANPSQHSGKATIERIPCCSNGLTSRFSV